MPRGRPSYFKKEYVAQAARLSDLGATDVDLADFFQVTINTIKNWKSAHPEFLAALKLGKDAADNRVIRSLYQRATGYTYDAVKIFMPAGATEPVYAPYREHVPPDPTSMIFWLKNRQPQLWRDVHRHEVGGPGDFDRLTDEELLERAITQAKAMGASEDEIAAIRRMFGPKPQMIEAKAEKDETPAK